MGDLMRPAPRRSLAEHAVAVLRWIGVGRLAAIGASVVAVAAGSFWLLRTPESASSDRAVPVASALPPTVPSASGTTPAAGTGGIDDPGAEDAAADPATPPAPTTTAAPVVVHVAGAVIAPGVYPLGSGARVGDAVAAAGGAAADAALDAINLAAPLADGQQVYVPHVSEATGPAPPAPVPPTAGAGPRTPGPLDLNTATEEQLLDLPGVGPVLAAAIVRHREETGPFTSVDGLLDVSGIGPARLESLRDLVRV